MFSICVFHKDEGFFLKDIYFHMKASAIAATASLSDQAAKALADAEEESELQKTRAKIIVVLGANSLGLLTAGLLTSFISYLAYRFLILPILGLRVSKEHEILGQDTFSQMSSLSSLGLENHISDLVNEFYPDNIQDFLRKKRKLLKNFKAGSERAKGQLAFEDLPKLLKYIE